MDKQGIKQYQNFPPRADLYTFDTSPVGMAEGR